MLNNSTFECQTLESLLHSGNEAMATHRAYLQKIQDSLVTNKIIATDYEHSTKWGGMNAYLKYEKAQKEIKTAKEALELASTSIKIEFCTKCCKTFDPRTELGKFLPAIRKSLEVIKLNEESGFFLLPTPNNGKE